MALTLGYEHFARYSTDSNGNTALVLPDGTSASVYKISVVKIKITADTAGLVTGDIIPMNVVERDDIGTTTANIAANPGRVYIPSTAKFIRVTARVAYAYVDASPEGTYRGAASAIYLDAGVYTLNGITGSVVVPTLVSPVSPVMEGIVMIALPLFDFAAAYAAAEGATENNWIQINAVHNSATTPTVIEGTAASNAAYLHVEIWE